MTLNCLAKFSVFNQYVCELDGTTCERDVLSSREREKERKRLDSNVPEVF